MDKSDTTLKTAHLPFRWLKAGKWVWLLNLLSFLIVSFPLLWNLILSFSFCLLVCKLNINLPAISHYFSPVLLLLTYTLLMYTGEGWSFKIMIHPHQIFILNYMGLPQWKPLWYHPEHSSLVKKFLLKHETSYGLMGLMDHQEISSV